MTLDPPERREIPTATVNRLPIYLRALRQLSSNGHGTVHSEALAEQVGVSSAKLRKDLSSLGSYGTRGVGYDVDTLVGRITGAMGLERQFSVAIVGMGNLGRALATYGGIGVKGFDVKWLIDDNPAVVGTMVGDLPVVPFDSLIPAQNENVIGVIAVPAGAAQQVADRLIEVGVRAILNFAPSVLVVPDSVQVRGVDMASELQILAFRDHSMRGEVGSREMKELLA